MSVAQLLNHLRSGDVIIVRGGAMASRPRQPVRHARVDAIETSAAGSLELLRNLIAVRKDGGKK